MFIICDEYSIVKNALCNLRVKLAKDNTLVNKEDYFKKEYTHIIENKGKLIKESTFLSNLFDKNSKIC